MKKYHVIVLETIKKTYCIPAKSTTQATSLVKNGKGSLVDEETWDTEIEDCYDAKEDEF